MATAKKVTRLRDSRPPNPYRRDNQIALRVNDEEMKLLREKADEWSGGNVSDYVRIAATRFRPTKADLAESG